MKADIMSDTTHPLETVFDLDPGSTQLGVLSSAPAVPAIVQEPTEETSDRSKYDDRDVSIDEQLTTIQQEALEMAAMIKQTAAYADPKQLARLGEVSATSLQTALDAIKQKADIKKHKDKIASAAQGGAVTAVHTTTNNTVIVDRSELLRRAKNSSNIIESGKS